MHRLPPNASGSKQLPVAVSSSYHQNSHHVTRRSHRTHGGTVGSQRCLSDLRVGGRLVPPNIPLAISGCANTVGLLPASKRRSATEDRESLLPMTATASEICVEVGRQLQRGTHGAAESRTLLDGQQPHVGPDLTRICVQISRTKPDISLQPGPLTCF